MLNSLARGALVALALGTGFAGLGSAPASAAGIRVVIDDGVRVDPVQYRDFDDRRDDFDRPGRDFDRPGRDFDRRDRDFDRRDRDRDFGRGACSPRLALRKAFDIGLNRPRVVRAGGRFVIVDGFRRGRIATVRFANDRGCPVLDVRR